MNDAINRQAAVDAVNKIAPVNTEYDCILLDRLDVRYVLTELPSVETERRLTCKNCIHLGHAYMMPCKNCKRNQMLPDWYEVETERKEE